MIVERVTEFVADPEAANAGSFAELVREAFAFQYENIPAFRRLCDARGVTPGDGVTWHDVPMVPTTAFASVELRAAEASEVFRSSGTTGGERSVHHHAFPDLYRRVVDGSFPAFCLPFGDQLPMLSLIPSREQVPDSSLSFMVDHVLNRFAAPGSPSVFRGKSLDTIEARTWAGVLQRGGQPGLILTTAFALAQWLDRLEHLGLRFRLPPGTAIFETGGFKGKTQELSRDELAAKIETFLGVPSSAIVREYGMTELTSQCYTRSLFGEDPDLFRTPAWMRFRVLDPETLEEAPAGSAGLLALFDLANLSSAIHLLTEDLAVAEGEGFRLLGRAAEAQLRGCSLTAEEMLG